MKKKIKSILAILCATLTTVSFAGCEEPLSAYDIAKQNGFTGTEAEWLLSLKGEDGQNAPSLTFEQMYEEAQAKGVFSGSFLDFCKEMGVEVNENNDTATIAKNITSIVSINCAFYQSVRNWTTTTRKYYGSSAGSGVIVDLNKQSGSAYIVTNYHVVYDADCDTQNKISNEIYLYPYGTLNYFDGSTGTDTQGKPLRATYVGGAMDYDIAILKVEGSEWLKSSITTEATVGNSEEVKVGEKVYAIGNPEGAGIAVTSGVISVESEYITMTATDSQYRSVDYRVMRTDAAINGGNSGGGLFNANGDLIGIVNAKSVGEELDNMGYALPISQVRHIYDNIMDNGGKEGNGVVKRAMLGVNVSKADINVTLDENGNLVTKETFMVVGVGENSETTAAYGKLQIRDIFRSIQIIKANGEAGEVIALTRQYQLNDVLLTVRKGDTVVLGITRNDNNVGDIFVQISYDNDNFFTTYA